MGGLSLPSQSEKVMLWAACIYYLRQKVMFWSACIYLLVCMYVCMLPTFLKNYWTELHEIFRDDLSSSKDQSIRFWERSGQRSRSRSQKGQTRIFVITRSVFVRFIWNQCQNVHFSIPYPLIWRQMWHWRRYEFYRVVFMYVCMLPTFLKNYWTELHEIFRDDLSSSKDQSIRFCERSGQRSRKGQKLLDRIAWNFQGWFVIIQGPID